MSEEIKNNQPIEDDEIDLIALTKTIWEGRKTIIKSIVICAVIGVTVALLSPKEYTASTIMVPQTSQGTSKLGGLGGLAAMAGFNLNLNQSGNELSPAIYPHILGSVLFQLEIMETPFTFSGIDKQITLFDYYTEYSKLGILSLLKKYTIGLPGVITGTIKGKPNEPVTKNDTISTAIKLTNKQETVRKIIAANISLSINDKEGYLSLTSNFHDAYLTAQVTEKAQKLLQKYITEFKIKKASNQLDFIKKRRDEKKKDFENTQTKLADFRDRNKNVTSALARTEEDRLQNEYQLAFDVYSELAQQMEQAQIKVKEDTPVFSIIKPVTVPLEKTKPKRAMILVIWLFLGGVIGVGWIFGKQFLVSVREKWEETEN